MKNIESILALLGLKPGKNLSDNFFIHFESSSGTHLFMYKRLRDNAIRFSSASGEWDGNIYDVITFYYQTDNSSDFNEADRLTLFKRDNDLKNDDLNFSIGELKPVPHFNLYKLMFKEYGNCKDDVFNNALESSTHLYFFFMDEDVTPSRQHNILGVVAYDKSNKDEETVVFSNLDRSIYFSNPSINSNEAVVFNSFKEMIAFRKRMPSNFFYIVFKGGFNTSKAKTISLISETKGIKNTFLAFPDKLTGYYRDIEYLSINANVEIKQKTGYLKLSVPQNSQSDIFIQKLKELKSNIEKELEQNSIKNLLTIKAGKNLANEAVFVVEIASIANIFKGFLVLASKYLLAEKNFKIVKPKGIYWAQEQTSIENVGKEFKLNIYDTIGKVYQYN
ncbi:MAG: hypothetical protein AAF348_10930 [Bacteroidota bacterium]